MVVSYICSKCNKIFKQKSHLDSHLLKKYLVIHNI